MIHAAPTQVPCDGAKNRKMQTSLTITPPSRWSHACVSKRIALNLQRHTSTPARMLPQIVFTTTLLVPALDQEKMPLAPTLYFFVFMSMGNVCGLGSHTRKHCFRHVLVRKNRGGSRVRNVTKNMVCTKTSAKTRYTIHAFCVLWVFGIQCPCVFALLCEIRHAFSLRP